MTTTTPSESPAVDLEAVNQRLGDADAPTVVRWAADTFGDALVMTSSFGAQSAVTLHLVTRVAPAIPVILIDTGYLFPETYRFAEHLRDRLDLNLKIFRPRLSAAHFEATRGRLWEQGEAGHEAYLQARKVEPMQRALRELGAAAWIAGLRSGQTDYRAQLPRVAVQDERYKIHPILGWSRKDVHDYLKAHELPAHPLYERGYTTIGDVHSTVPVGDAGGDSEQAQRAARFHGLKQECGLHVPASAEENQSRGSSGL